MVTGHRSSATGYWILRWIHNVDGRWAVRAGISIPQRAASVTSPAERIARLRYAAGVPITCLHRQKCNSAPYRYRLVPGPASGAVAQLPIPIVTPAEEPTPRDPSRARVQAIDGEGRNLEDEVAHHLERDGSRIPIDVTDPQLTEPVVSPAVRLVEEGERAAVESTRSHFHEDMATLYKSWNGTPVERAVADLTRAR